MPHIVACRERFWKVIYDTLYFGSAQDGVPPEFCTTLAPGLGMAYRLFNHDCFPPFSNMATAGQLPNDNSFRLTELGLRVDMDGPIAPDMLRSWLRAMSLNVFVDGKLYGEIPPGGYYPPGMTESLDTFLGKSADDDETPQHWADARLDALHVPVLYPSDGGYVIGGRGLLDIQVELRGGRVTFEESNGGRSWIDITRSVENLGATNKLGWAHFDEPGYGVATYKLRCNCTSNLLRVRWYPTESENSIKLTVMAHVNSERALRRPELFQEEPEPPWMRGGFCRFVPIKPSINFLPRQSFHAEMLFSGVGARALSAAHADGLLHGEVAVLLGGQLVRDIH